MKVLFIVKFYARTDIPKLLISFLAMRVLNNDQIFN